MDLIRIGFLLIAYAIVVQCSESSRIHWNAKNSLVELILETDECEDVGFTLLQFNKVVFQMSLDHKKPLNTVIKRESGTDIKEVILFSIHEEILIEIKEDSLNQFAIQVSRRKVTAQESLVDCLNLAGHNWYGGPQQRRQLWPVEKLTLSNYSYVTKEADSAAIVERYWLNSGGAYIYLSDRIPLFIDQNSRKKDHLCFIAEQTTPYSTLVGTYDFEYIVGVGNDPRETHMHVVNNILGKPSGVPDTRMAALPIWSTWARYKRDINHTVVMKFAKEIVDNRFKNSQFEIDDDWEVCYGALTFRTEKFPDIKATVKQLKDMGFRVTLWIHPFINKGCDPWYSYALAHNFLVLDHNNISDTEWWNSEKGQAAYIDFTNEKAAEWFSNRLLQLLIDTGIDSYKFDAGESSWQPDISKNNHVKAPLVQQPQRITTEYIRTVAKFGPIVEVRSGFLNQHEQIYMRMIDKDSLWTWDNGLPTLVTTLLQLNMNGYPLVLPDMIGGNGYDNMPPREMFIRWLQANVFMPSLQFSYVPWDYSDGNGIKIVDLCREFVELHEKYADHISRAFDTAVMFGNPVNAPIWWIDPNNPVAHGIYDEFLLGEDILSAPVLEEGKTSRDIYLPAGDWRDGNTNKTYRGPLWLRNYPAPLTVLPYFIRVK
ncbi:uncharacterized family 31 glucosidase KIAA1161 [Sergentomyia squamirostris]